MTTSQKVSDYLLNNTETLAINIVDKVINTMNLEIPELERTQAITMYIEFIRCLGEYVINEEEKIPDSLIAWSKKNAGMVSLEGKISTIFVRYPPTRDIITDILTDLGIEHKLSLKDHGKLIKQVNRLLDISLNETIFAFEHLTDEYQKETQRELAKLSAPIVPVKDGVVVLPLVGSIDSYKTQYLIENVVPKLAGLGINHVIADFSGVPNLNQEHVFHLHHIGQMLRLMGIHVISTGIRPELAQLAVKTGLDLSRGETYANLKKALESLE